MTNNTGNIHASGGQSWTFIFFIGQMDQLLIVLGYKLILVAVYTLGSGKPERTSAGIVIFYLC